MGCHYISGLIHLSCETKSRVTWTSYMDMGLCFLSIWIPGEKSIQKLHLLHFPLEISLDLSIGSGYPQINQDREWQFRHPSKSVNLIASPPDVNSMLMDFWCFSFAVKIYGRFTDDFNLSIMTYFLSLKNLTWGSPAILSISNILLLWREYFITILLFNERSCFLGLLF